MIECQIAARKTESTLVGGGTLALISVLELNCMEVVGTGYG